MHWWKDNQIHIHTHQADEHYAAAADDDDGNGGDGGDGGDEGFRRWWWWWWCEGNDAVKVKLNCSQWVWMTDWLTPTRKEQWWWCGGGAARPLAGEATVKLTQTQCLPDGEEQSAHWQRERLTEERRRC